MTFGIQAHTPHVAGRRQTSRKRASRGGKTPARKADESTQLGGQRLTHPDRVLFPRDAITKLQLAEYFAAVGEAAMPHLRGRPLSVLRNVYGPKPFFQKHFLDESSGGLRVVDIPNADKRPDYVVCDSPQGLLHLAQLGVVEIHSWGARMPRPHKADRITLDLDPGAGLPYAPLRDAALAIRKLLREQGLESWVKTTGGKGLHVVVPLTAPLPDWSTAKDFAFGITRYFERIAPQSFTSKTGERNRKGKIFIDYLRNQFGATAIASYSPRWRPGAGVSTPIAWEELDEDCRGTHFNIHNVPDRLARQRRDPWQGYFSVRQSLKKSILASLPSTQRK